VAVDRIPEDNPKRRNGAREQGQRDPPPEPEQNQGPGRERDPVLKQAAHALEQGDRAVRCIGAGSMELVMVLGGVVQGEIDARGALLNEVTDVVLDQLGLSGTDPARSRSE
jgi:hypothetical protein